MENWNKWILLASSVTLSLALGEVFVRISLGDQIVLFPRYHATATYGEFTIRRLRPHSTFWHTSVDGSWLFVVNEQGFRDNRDFSYDRNGDGLRVVVVGDSHTQGFEARQDHTYAAVIERYLDTRGQESEVINAGVSGFGTAEAAVFLEHEGFAYNPDVVVLGFYANDFEDNIKSDLFRLKNNELASSKTKHAPGTTVLELHNAVAPLRWLSENSYFYSLMMNTLWELAKSALLSKKRGELTEWAVATREADDYEMRLTTRLIEHIYHLCKIGGIMFILVDIPQAGEPGGFASSIPSHLLAEFERSSDALIRSDEVLSQYRNLAEFHVPHGQRHISELSHMLLGVAVAQAIQGLVAPDKVADGSTTALSAQMPQAQRPTGRPHP